MRDPSDRCAACGCTFALHNITSGGYVNACGMRCLSSCLGFVAPEPEPDLTPLDLAERIVQGRHVSTAGIREVAQKLIDVCSDASIDRILLRVVDTADTSSLWKHTRRDPAAFRRAVRVALGLE